jgi:hypothetical protein
MPEGGFEPPQGKPHMALNHARLPDSATPAKYGKKLHKKIALSREEN